MRLPIVLVLAAGAATVPACAQDRARGGAVTTPPGGQIESGADKRTTAADQVSSQRRGRPAVDQVTVGHAGRPSAPQVSTPTASRQPLPGQVTRERRSARGVAQLAGAEPSAAAPESPARRSDSRPGGVVRVAGRDRCDPADADAGGAACANVIETRAADYQAPQAPTLSPEQRLLLTQDPAQAPGLRGAAERVARNDVDPNAIDTQTLAAITREPVVESNPARPNASVSPTDAAVADLIGQIINAAQAVPPR